MIVFSPHARSLTAPIDGLLFSPLLRAVDVLYCRDIFKIQALMHQGPIRSKDMIPDWSLEPFPFRFIERYNNQYE